MTKIFNKIWDEVQNRVETGIRLNLLTKNINPTNKSVEKELDKQMQLLVGKLLELAS